MRESNFILDMDFLLTHMSGELEDACPSTM